MLLNETCSQFKKTLIIGYGNTLRQDDGAGIAVADFLLKQNLSNTEVRVTQQLHVEFIEDLCDYDQVVLVDAAENQIEEVLFKKIESEDGSRMTSSHHLGSQILLTLAESLYDQQLNLYVCSIKTKSVGMGEELSEEVTHYVQQAVELILKFIQTGEVSHA